MSDNTIIKIGCGILLGGMLLAVSCVGMTGALVATGASVEKAAATERSNNLKLGEPRLKVTTDRFMAKAAWGIRVTNTSTVTAFVTVHADFLDEDGLVVVQDLLFNEPIPAGGERDLTGLRHVQTGEAPRIHSIRITVD